MSSIIKNIILNQDMIYLKILKEGKTTQESINLKEKGIYADNDKQVTIQILKYAIENNYEFNRYNNKTKPYFLTMKNINKLHKKEQVILDNNLLYREFENSTIGLYIQSNQIKEYLYQKTDIKIDHKGIVENIDTLAEYKLIRNMFKEPLKINKEEYKKMIQENREKIFNCQYLVSKTGKRYIVLKNDEEIEKNDIAYLKLINKRNELFSRYTGISNIHLVDSNLCMEDTFLGCKHYETRKELIEHLHKTEVVEKLDLYESNEEEI